MNFLELIILAIGLSMDAFAVSIGKGLSMKKNDLKKAAIIGLYFGGFQAGMPLIGYFLGAQFQNKIASIDHWIAFVLLGVIGVNMIREALSGDDDADDDDTLSVKSMLILSIATSIDALAVGVTFAFLNVNILFAASTIGLCTFLLSAIGVRLGNTLGAKYKSRAELTGGIILIAMGIKILLSHLL